MAQILLRYLVLIIALLAASVGAFAENEDIGIVDKVSNIKEVKKYNTEVQFCFNSNDLKSDFDQQFSTAIARLKTLDPKAIDDRFNEVCVIPSQVFVAQDELTYLEKKFNQSKKDITITFYHDKNLVEAKPESAKPNNKLILALRGAAAGVVGAAISNALTPVIKEVTTENGKPRKFVSYKTAAFIGAVVDYMQRANNEDNEEKILRNDGAAVFVTNLFRYKNQFTYELGLVMTLTSVPYFDNKLNELSQSVSKDIDWRVVIPLLATFAYVGRNEVKNPIRVEARDKGLGFLAYAAFGHGLGMKYNNPNFGFLSSIGLLLLDEANDSLKGSGGNPSARDAFFGTLGAVVGAILSDYLPPNYFVQLYGKAIFATYQKQF